MLRLATRLAARPPAFPTVPSPPVSGRRCCRSLLRLPALSPRRALRLGTAVRQRFHCSARRWASTSSWATLGLRQGGADAVAVKKAYFERARDCHPDLAGAAPENVRQFQELSLAVDEILRELAPGPDDAEAAGEATRSGADVTRDDPNFASSFWEHISKEMSASTRAEIKAAVKMGGGGLDRGGWWAAAQQMAADIDAAEAEAAKKADVRRLEESNGGSAQEARESAGARKKARNRRRR